MPKKYIHSDKFVELEFQNLYTEIRKQSLDIVRGVAGAPGAAGPDGAPGQSAIQTLITVATSSGDTTLGTVPINSIIFDIWCILYSWDGSNDTVTFKLKANDVDVISTEITLNTPPTILWPITDFFDGTNTFYGSLTGEDKVIKFNSPRDGQFLVCLNYIPTVGLLI